MDMEKTEKNQNNLKDEQRGLTVPATKLIIKLQLLRQWCQVRKAMEINQKLQK